MMEKLNEALAQSTDFVRVVVCTSDDIADLEITLMIHPIDTLLLYDTGNHPVQFHGSLHERTTKVTSERMLATRLCTKAVSCLHAEALQHQQNQNHGLANMCFNDAKRVVQWSMTFL